MAFHHRKLIFESLDMNSTGKTCSSYYCNAKENPSEICPLSCLYICYPNCSFPLFSEIQPPLPPNFFTPKILLPPSPHKTTISIFLIIIISFLATSFFVFCCFVVYKCRNSRVLSLGQQQVEEEEEEFSDIVDEDFHGPMVDHPIWYIRTVGLQPSVISAITICKYKRGEGLIEGTDCAVCLSEFQEDETLRILPKCNHAFHIPCIDTWLRSHTNCPLCRAGIIIATTVPSPSPEQDLGLRHDEETRSGIISENATELRIEIENEGESADISSMDIRGDSKEDVGNGNEGELGEFYASRVPASSESLSTTFMARIASTDANSSREQSTDQNSLEVNDSEMGTSMSQSCFDSNESSAEKRNFCVDRVIEREQMRSLSFSTKVVIKRSQSAALLR